MNANATRTTVDIERIRRLVREAAEAKRKHNKSHDHPNPEDYAYLVGRWSALWCMMAIHVGEEWPEI